ncbi:MAG: hypothetical protein KA436_02525 [Oligoflexales bacterium]|nr:hypothetical protein [Oligoflexales bacterium]
MKENSFSIENIRTYPHSTRKVDLNISPYFSASIEKNKEELEFQKAVSTCISPHGLEFLGLKTYPEGTLLKINISIPDYWKRKKQLVNYNRIDQPESFRILGRVIHVESEKRKGKKKAILVQTVNIDEIDEQILRLYLQESCAERRQIKSVDGVKL